jgi:HK97 family phage major capsid protein
MNLTEMITSIEDEIERARQRADNADGEIKSMLDTARAEGRKVLTENESARTDALFHDIDMFRAGQKRSEARLARAREIEAEERELDKRSRVTRDSGARLPKYDEVARVGREARTYSPENDPGRTGEQFIVDLCRQYLYNDPQANERLARHMREERVERPQYAERAVGTGAFTGLIVPQYLIDLVAPATAALRPLADNMNNHPLPPNGMSVNISRITTASSAALQASENTAVSSTDMDDTLLTVNVQTSAGQQVVSRQAIERGIGVEETVVGDLMRRIATNLDSTLINQASTGALATGQVTTQGTVGATNTYTAVYQAESLLEQALMGVAVPNCVFMHSRRLNFIVSTIGSTWPLIGGANVPAQNAGVVVSNEYGSGPRLILPNGLRVYVDNNIPVNLGAGTNEDRVLMVASQEAHLWEDASAPVLIRCEQPSAASLGVLLVAYSYFAYSFARYPNNPGVIGGAGLVAPAGF